MSDFSFDLTGVLGTQDTTPVATNSTNKKAGSDLVMDDFLKLMVAQFQNQRLRLEDAGEDERVAGDAADAPCD